MDSNFATLYFVQYCKGDDISILMNDRFEGIVDINAQDELGLVPKRRIFLAA